jgi:hypothetical protein
MQNQRVTRTPRWQLLVVAGYAALSIAAIAYRRDEPFWIGFHAVTAAASVVCVLWPRTWVVGGALALAVTFWGGWEWSRIIVGWLEPRSPIAYSEAEIDAALSHTWELTVVTLWLNVVLMMVWTRRKPGEPVSDSGRTPR